MCFACGKDNPIGLHITYHVDGDVCTAEFTPNENHLSWEARRKSDRELIAECTASFLVGQ